LVLPLESALNTTIAMMGELIAIRTARSKRLLQSVQDKLGIRRRGDLPANNIAGKDIDDEGNIDKANSRAHIRKVGHP
jgi:hypothetical protein